MVTLLYRSIFCIHKNYATHHVISLSRTQMNIVNKESLVAIVNKESHVAVVNKESHVAIVNKESHVVIVNKGSHVTNVFNCLLPAYLG